MNNYKLVYFDNNRYYTKHFKAKDDKTAIEVSKTHDMGMGICFDLFKNKEIIFNDDVWNMEGGEKL